ncbi:MAG: TetR/AcrR family transcriptional regulator [Desulfobacterales bacterium]|nr:TetR/AcrR family transcriptional regulator [Desulfobacterales bacterium]
MLEIPVKKKIVKERLLAEAEILFALKGFYETRIHEITGAAGCNASAINYYFGSKEMLFLKVFQKRWREKLIDVRKALEKTFATQAAVSPDGLTPPPDVVKSVTTFFERQTSDDDMGAFLFDLMPITRKLTGNGQGDRQRGRIFSSLVEEFKDVLRPFMPVSYTESILMQTALKIMVHILFSGYVDMLTIQTANMDVNTEAIFV